MAMEEFTTCFADKVGTTVDGVVALTSALGEDGVRTVRDTWNSMPEEDRKVIEWLAGISVGALGKILTRIFGIAVADALLVFVGAFSWGILIASLVACAYTFL